MAKSMRCKREKRLRAIRREMVEPYYDKKDEAKLAAQEAALAAPKLPVRPLPKSTTAMEVTTTDGASASTSNMDVDMDAVNERIAALKPAGGVGKKSKKGVQGGQKKAPRQGRKEMDMDAINQRIAALNLLVGEEGQKASHLTL